MLGILVASIGTMAFYTIRMLQSDMQRQLGEQQFATVTLLAQGVDDELKARINSMEQYAKGRIIPSMLNAPEALQERLAGSPAILSMFNGGLFVTGLDGFAIASVPKSAGRVGINYMDRDSIATALRQGQPAIGKPVMGKRLLSPVLTIAVPIRDAQDQVIGALAGITDLGKPGFLDKITQNRYGRTGGFLLIDLQNRLVVTATDKHLIMQPVPAPGINAMHDKYMQGHEGYGVAVNENGVSELSAAKRIPVTGWIIVATLSVEEAFAPIAAMRQRLLLSALFFGFLASLLTWWLITRLLQRRFAPMLNTSRALSNLATSDQPVQTIPITSQDEIGELVGGFNRLLEVLGNREEALRESQFFLCESQRIGQIGGWRADPIGKQVVWTEGMYAITEKPLDYRPDFETSLEAYHPDSRKIIVENLTSALQSGKTFTVQVEVRGAQSGRHKWCELRGFPHRDTEGRIDYVMGTLQDISEHKRLEDELIHHRLHLESLVDQRTSALHDTETKYRMVADFTYDWESWIDASGGWLYCSPACERVTGYRPEEFMARPELYLDITYPDDRAELLSHLQEGERNGICSLEFRIHHKNGDVRWIKHLCQPVKDASGKSLGRRVSNRDITDRKHADTLLHQARDAAEAANIAKSTFLSNMSHEIRTPLNGIVGLTHILRRGDVTPIQADRLQKIDSAAAHLLSLINDILDLSKIEAGKIVLEDAPVAINSLLTNVKSIMGARAQSKMIHLRVETGSRLPDVQGDSTRLQQALLNYVGNAIKFTETGTITLRSLILEEDVDSVLIRFEVQDTGIGISAEASARLFSPFVQADDSTTRNYGGTGLGLTITKRLAELMGGEAGVESVLGVGSTFWFTARLARSKKPASIVQHEVTESEATLRQHHQGRRILIVDDEPLNLEVAKCMLEDIGLIVDTADDGESALSKANETAYAAILMDMQMPRLDGIEATKQLRKLPDYRETPILAMTANAFAEDRARCLASGMSDFIAKPFNPDGLYTIVLKWLERKTAT